MATKTITNLTTGTAANLTGAAWGVFDDASGLTRKHSMATLRTKMFAGGTGYTASDPLVVGDTTATTVTVGSTAAASGVIRIPNAANGIRARNAANSGDIAIIDLDASNITNIGNGASGVAFLARTTTIASASGGSGFNLPHGAAPSSPVNGDMWTTTGGAFIRINGVTKTFTLT